MRKLNAQEKAVISGIALMLNGEQRARLLDDLESASVLSEASDGSRVVFQIAQYQRPHYRGQHLFGAEGKMVDRDGADLSVLLYADENDRLLELEIVRWGTGELLGPRWDTLTLQ